MTEKVGCWSDTTSRGQRLNDISLVAQFIVSTAPEPRRVRDLRVLSRAHLNAWGFTADTADTVELLLSEIVTNAVKNTDSQDITLTLSYADDVVCLDVGDSTPGQPHMRIPGPDDESGRGLLIVNALAKEWGTSEDGSSVWCTVQRTPSGH
jgi:anti-sigma regulatory factor (Ser/Thr protein kinase)